MRIILLALLSVPGGALALAWYKSRHRTALTSPTIWTAINIGSLILMTTGYLYFMFYVVLMFTNWRTSFERSLWHQHEIASVVMNILVGLLGAVLAIWGRGVARIQVLRAGVIFALMWIFILVAGLSG